MFLSTFKKKENEEKNVCFFIVEFRTQLESIERTASLMAQLELDEQYERAEMFLKDLKEKFDRNLCEKVMKSVEDQEKNFEELRPTLGHPSRKSELEQLDQREKKRLDTVQQSLNQLRVETKVKIFVLIRKQK